MSSNGYGRLTIEYTEPVIAGQLTRVVFEYTVGERGFAQDGRLRIGLPNCGWAEPLVPQYYFWSEYASGKDRVYTQYDRVNTTARIESSAAAVPLLECEARFRKPWSYPPAWLRDYDRWWITVTVEDAALVEGDTIRVTYGDPLQHPLTARVQRFPERGVCYLAYVDPSASGTFHELAETPWFVDVHAGPAAELGAIVPSIVKPGDEPRLRVAYMDEVRARPEPTPSVHALRLIRSGQPPEEQAVDVDAENDSTEISLQASVAASSEGSPVRICVQDRDLGLEARSNPMLHRSDGCRLFWGDLHGQSRYHGWNAKDQRGIGCGTLEECYAYARDIAGLDFCAITDTHSIVKDIWEETVETAMRMHAPGRFVTFQGSEVGSDKGHRNAIFGGDTPEPGWGGTAQSGDAVIARGDNLAASDVPELHKRYHGRDDVILIPHHTKVWLNWDYYNAALEPVLEIYSIWGSGEKSGTHLWERLREMTGGAQEAWSRGYRIGVIAGSDTHAGMPGRSLPYSDRNEFHIYKAGYAAVWAEELSRESILRALRARRCYGTTGVRIILETFLDGHPMGSDVAWPDTDLPRMFQAHVWAEDEIESIVVVKNNRDVHVCRPRSDQAQLEWEDRTKARNGDFYYVRVQQCDGNHAWSSPIWLDT